MRRFSRFSYIGALMIALCVLAPHADAQNRRDIRRAEDLVRDGNTAFNRKDYRAAIAKYAEAIVLVPTNAAAHFWKGMGHFYLDEPQMAVQELDRAESLGFERPMDIFRARWRIHYQAESYDAAMRDVRAGLAIDPTNADMLLAKADMDFVNERYSDALVSYESVLPRVPNNADIYLNVAKIHYNLNNVQGQSAAALEALAKGTTKPGDAYLLLGDAFQKQRRFPEAIDNYQRALAADPKNYEMYRSLADLYRVQNRFDDAIAISRKALSVFPNDGNIYTDVSWYYSLADRHEEAIQAAQAGIRFLPGGYMAYTNLCRAYNDTRRPELAVTACNNALRLKPGDGETHFYLARAFSLLNRPAEATKNVKLAITGLEQFTRERPDYSDGYYLLGNAYFTDGQADKAIAAYERCLALSPRFAKARFNLGLLHIGKGDKAKAIEQYNSLIALDRSLADNLKEQIDKL
ncbi:MAG: tetratricopeptide repeat protein [Blastocatellia bacterium]|nr:tetratricopeptide repeat protein [Blastocatellia bacterium]